LKLWLVAYAQAFLDFVLPLFVAPSLARMTSITKFGIVSMGRAKEGIGTMMEVDSIVVKVATESIQVAPNTTEATIKIIHPLTLSTIVETKEGTENP